MPAKLRLYDADQAREVEVYAIEARDLVSRFPARFSYVGEPTSPGTEGAPEGWLGMAVSELDPTPRLGAMAVTATGGTAGRTLADRFGDFPTVEDWRGSGGDPSDTGTWQAALAAMELTGGKLSVPAGSYTLEAAAVLDLSTMDSYTKELGVNIEGAGSSSTEIRVAHAGIGLKIIGQPLLGIPRTILRGMKFAGTTDRTGIGLSGDNLANCEFNDLLFYNMEYGYRFTDILSSIFYNVQSKWCKYGGNFDGKVDASQANAIEMIRCQWGNNYEYGLYVKSSAQFNFFGGSAEGNGRLGSGATTDRFGIKLDTPNLNGDMIAATAQGMWFENNAGTADLWYVNGADYMEFNALRCMFLRLHDTLYTDFPIRIDLPASSGDVHAHIDGNTFVGYSPYVADVARPYVKQFVTAGVLTYSGRNRFADSVETPSTFVTGQVFARCNFNGTLATPTPSRAQNVASITKNATGDYTITFARAGAVSTKHIAVCLISAYGVWQKFAETSTTVRIRTANLSAVATDFALNIVIWD